MPDVVVGHSFDVAEPHGQHRLGAIQSLNLALLIDREHDGVVGGGQIEATTSRTFSTKNGSVESLKLLLRCGCREKS